MNIQFFFGQAISQSNSKPLIVNCFSLLRMSDGYCFRRAVQGQSSQRDRRIATVLRAVVKYHNCLNGTNVIACGCSRRNLTKFAGKSACWGTFVVKLQSVIAYKRLLGQLYQKRDANTETLTQILSVNFEKKI